MNPSPEYVELHCHSHFSLLDGASSPETLIKRAAELRMPALALTDHDAVYGAVRFHQAAQKYGIRPIFGSELTLHDHTHLTLLVENATGWANLCELISLARHNAPKGQARLPDGALEGHTEGLIGLSGCAQGGISKVLRRGDWQTARAVAGHYREVFGREQFWIELQHHQHPGDDALVYKLVKLAEQIGVGYVATQNVHYAHREESALTDVLTCIRQGLKLDAAARVLRPNSEYYLKSGTEMLQGFREYPAALQNTLRIAERCQFIPCYGLQELPNFPIPAGFDPVAYLRHLCLEALPHRLPQPPSKTSAVLEYELAVIARSGLSNYFLIVWDMVRYAREQGIRCQGRGSAANSLVAYLLGISPVNPIAHDLVFERFLSDERRATPDIDIDFQADRREEVIQYVFERYGTDHAAMASTLVTFRERLARREVGKILGLPEAVIEGKDLHSSLPASPLHKTYERLCQAIQGIPRHLGIHNGGMILTGTPLTSRLPTEPATMPDRVVVQWDKESLEDAGLVKIDLLGLRMLSAVSEAAHEVGLTDLETIPPDDPEVYELIARADTVGVFQVESRAQAQVLPLLQPTQFEDLVVSISLIRPGPVQGNMVHPYLRRRLKLEPVHYFHPLLEPALRETLGVILFQEQVLKVARDLGGFTPGQGELLRRALGSKSPSEAVAGFEAAFLEGAAKKGAPLEVAAKVFTALKAFGGYSFPKSHAAAFAVLVYQSAWLKRYHPAAFYTALLNHQPMGFWSPAVLVNDARRHGICVLNVDMNHSQGVCTLEGDAIRLGLGYVSQVSERHLKLILAARADRPFTDLGDFCRRVKLPMRITENLILAGAFDGLGASRRDLLWELGSPRAQSDELAFIFPTDPVNLTAFSRSECLRGEYATLGLSTGEHPMALYREKLAALGILGSQGLGQSKSGSIARVGGQVVMHQAPPTAKGHHFVTLEDEDGMMNLIFRPQVYARFHEMVRKSPLLVVEGEVQKRGAVVNLLARRVWRLG
ncbi:MAG: error-prone DNA polymerase [Anaerolinea sp.]|nr:error-prone DNA polymerase [Anaerolinea sp.]